MKRPKDMKPSIWNGMNAAQKAMFCAHETMFTGPGTADSVVTQDQINAMKHAKGAPRAWCELDGRIVLAMVDRAGRVATYATS